jgi:hypothetical protein
MTRRLAQVLLLVAAASSLTACSGADARQAQQLLADAHLAQSKVVSATYDVRVVVAQGEKSYTLLMNGGGYLKGPRAGDQFLSMRGEGLPMQMQFDLVAVDRRATVRVNGRSQSFPMPSGAASSQSSNWAAIMGELSRYVKSVDVRENEVVAGTRGTTVAGVIDTAGLVKAVAGMSALSQASGAPAVDQLAKDLGDTRIVLFISARTHLIRTAVINVDVKAAGKTAKVRLFYSLRSVNKPVALPSAS